MNYCHTKLPQYSFIAVSSLLRGKIFHTRSHKKSFFVNTMFNISSTFVLIKSYICQKTPLLLTDRVLIRFWVTYFPEDTKRSCGEEREKRVAGPRSLSCCSGTEDGDSRNRRKRFSRQKWSSQKIQQFWKQVPEPRDPCSWGKSITTAGVTHDATFSSSTLLVVKDKGQHSKTVP